MVKDQTSEVDAKSEPDWSAMLNTVLQPLLGYT
jgi:hypothetical protein